MHKWTAVFGTRSAISYARRVKNISEGSIQVLANMSFPYVLQVYGSAPSHER